MIRNEPVNVPPPDAVTSRPGLVEFAGWVVWAACTAACIVKAVKDINKARSLGEDSWYPMIHALDFMRGPNPDQVYQTLFFSQHVKFQYPPSGVLFLDLLQGLGVRSSADCNALNAGLMIVAGLALAAIAVRTLGPLRFLGIRIPVGPLAFLVTLRFYPNEDAFYLGQVQVWLNLLFVLSCLALLFERRFIAGCLIGAAALVKPQFLPLGLLALLHRDWRFLGGLTVLVTSGFLASVSRYGLNAFFNYLPVLKFLSLHGEFEQSNQSINGIVGRLVYDGPPLDIDPQGPIVQSMFPPYIPVVYYTTLLTSIAMIAIPFLVQAWRDTRVARAHETPLSRMLSICFASTLFTMASPISWLHHYGILLPGYVVVLKLILDREEGAGRWGALIALGASFLMTAVPLSHLVDPTSPGAGLIRAHVFIGAWILLGLMLGNLIERPAPSPSLSAAALLRETPEPETSRQ